MGTHEKKPPSPPSLLNVVPGITSQMLEDLRRREKTKNKFDEVGTSKRQRSELFGSQAATRRTDRDITVQRSLFEGAEARSKYFVVIRSKDGETTNFADLNYKCRLDAIRKELGMKPSDFVLKKVEMKKFKGKQEVNYKVEVSLDFSEDMKKLLQVQELAGCKVKIGENLNKNTIKGLIIDFDDDLKGMSNDQLLEAVTLSGVRAVQRFGNSKVIQLCFAGQFLPERVTFWNQLSFKVKVYVPPPSRCFKCQGYGHMSRSCRNDHACYKCAFKSKTWGDHDPKTCKEKEKCVNCDGAHVAGNKVCEFQKLEVKWATISFEQKITRDEAKRKYPEGKRPTFADAVRSQEPIQMVTPTLQTAVTQLVDEGDSHMDAETSGSSVPENEKEIQKWRLDQEKKMQELLGRIDKQESAFTTIQRKMEVQDKLIASLRVEMEQKDDEIKSLKEEKEELIVANEKLRSDANRTMTEEIKKLQKLIKNGNTPMDEKGKK